MLAAQRVHKLIKLGHELRADGFFQGEPGNRSLEEEIVEGVLIAAQREHEELKLPYLANLLAAMAFATEIQRGEANLLLRLANAMSYRQLCLIALVEQKNKFPEMWQGRTSEKSLDGLAADQRFAFIALLKEMAELYDLGVLHQTIVGIPMETYITIRLTELGTWGSLLYEAMGLDEIPNDQLTPLAQILS